jgi:hypothetical protein
MNKLELKEIVGYLPYGLKAVDDFGKARTIDWECQSYTNTIVGLNHVLHSQSVQVNCFKPILFPISSLTKFREDLRFVPIDFLEEKYFSSNLVSQCERLIEDERWIYHSDYILIEYFYEWKIDIHNLIDKGLAIAVTEDLNPYK